MASGPPQGNSDTTASTTSGTARIAHSPQYENLLRQQLRHSETLEPRHKLTDQLTFAMADTAQTNTNGSTVKAETADNSDTGVLSSIPSIPPRSHVDEHPSFHDNQAGDVSEAVVPTAGLDEVFATPTTSLGAEQEEPRGSAEEEVLTAPLNEARRQDMEEVQDYLDRMDQKRGVLERRASAELIRVADIRTEGLRRANSSSITPVSVPAQTEARPDGLPSRPAGSRPASASASRSASNHSFSNGASSKGATPPTRSSIDSIPRSRSSGGHESIESLGPQKSSSLGSQRSGSIESRKSASSDSHGSGLLGNQRSRSVENHRSESMRSQRSGSIEDSGSGSAEGQRPRSVEGHRRLGSGGSGLSKSSSSGSQVNAKSSLASHATPPASEEYQPVGSGSNPGPNESSATPSQGPAGPRVIRRPGEAIPQHDMIIPGVATPKSVLSSIIRNSMGPYSGHTPSSGGSYPRSSASSHLLSSNSSTPHMRTPLTTARYTPLVAHHAPSLTSASRSPAPVIAAHHSQEMLKTQELEQLVCTLKKELADRELEAQVLRREIASTTGPSVATVLDPAEAVKKAENFGFLQKEKAEAERKRDDALREKENCLTEVYRLRKKVEELTGAAETRNNQQTEAARNGTGNGQLVVDVVIPTPEKNIEKLQDRVLVLQHSRQMLESQVREFEDANLRMQAELDQREGEIDRLHKKNNASMSSANADSPDDCLRMEVRQLRSDLRGMRERNHHLSEENIQLREKLRDVTVDNTGEEILLSAAAKRSTEAGMHVGDTSIRDRRTDYASAPHISYHDSKSRLDARNEEAYLSREPHRDLAYTDTASPGHHSAGTPGSGRDHRRGDVVASTGVERLRQEAEMRAAARVNLQRRRDELERLKAVTASAEGSPTHSMNSHRSSSRPHGNYRDTQHTLGGTTAGVNGYHDTNARRDDREPRTAAAASKAYLDRSYSPDTARSLASTSRSPRMKRLRLSPERLWPSTSPILASSSARGRCSSPSHSDDTAILVSSYGRSPSAFTPNRSGDFVTSSPYRREPRLSDDLQSELTVNILEEADRSYAGYVDQHRLLTPKSSSGSSDPIGESVELLDSRYYSSPQLSGDRHAMTSSFASLPPAGKRVTSGDLDNSPGTAMDTSRDSLLMTASTHPGKVGLRSVIKPPTVTQHNKHELGNPKSSRLTASGKRPFAPRTLADLTLGDVVKYTKDNGRIAQGTVQFIGILHDANEACVGVELQTSDGSHNGMYKGVQYFHCEARKGAFIDFSRIILAWGD